MNTSDRFLTRRLLEPEALSALRRDAQADAVRVSRAMDDAHRLFHDDGHGWNKCDLDPCHSVGVLIGDMALLDLAIGVSGKHTA